MSMLPSPSRQHGQLAQLLLRNGEVHFPEFLAPHLTCFDGHVLSYSNGSNDGAEAWWNSHPGLLFQNFPTAISCMQVDQVRKEQGRTEENLHGQSCWIQVRGNMHRVLRHVCLTSTLPGKRWKTIEE